MLRKLAAIAMLTFALGTAPALAATPPAFLATAAVIDRTQALNPSLASDFFNLSTTFEIWSGSWASSAPNATRTAIFQNEKQLETAINAGTLPPSTRAVIYDDEAWSLTPLNQQQHPDYWYQRAANLAHSVGLMFIATPGTDLANVVNPGTDPSWQRFLAAGIVGPIAQNSDIYEVQAQALEAKPSTYESYVSQVANQAQAANPAGITMMAGLSTNPSGTVQPAPVLLAAAQASENDVRGWWLNDPGSGRPCPPCSGPYPQTVVGFLNGLASPPPTTSSPPPTTSSPPPTTSPPPSMSGGVPRPALSALSVFPHKLRAARTGKSITASPRVGTKVRFKLNVAANIRFTVKRQTEGRRIGNRCQALTPKNRTKPHCNYWKALKGSFTLNGKAGDNNFRFSGRFYGATLGLGVYRLIAIPTASSITGSAHHVRFTLVG
jgi:hypothetical protein